MRGLSAENFKLLRYWLTARDFVFPPRRKRKHFTGSEGRSFAIKCVLSAGMSHRRAAGWREREAKRKREKEIIEKRESDANNFHPSSAAMNNIRASVHLFSISSTINDSKAEFVLEADHIGNFRAKCT